MKKKALVVAHGGDPDGIISAASLHRYLSSEYEVEFMYVIYFIQKEAFERISRRANLRDYEMFVVDLSLNDYLDRKSTRLNSSHTDISRMPSSA